MSNRIRARRRFWRSTGLMFLIYAVVIPAIFFILDRETFVRLFRKEPLLFPLELAGAAFGISLIITAWTHRDPELQKW